MSRSATVVPYSTDRVVLELGQATNPPPQFVVLGPYDASYPDLDCSDNGEEDDGVAGTLMSIRCFDTLATATAWAQKRANETGEPHSVAVTQGSVSFAPGGTPMFTSDNWPELTDSKPVMSFNAAPTE